MKKSCLVLAAFAITAFVPCVFAIEENLEKPSPRQFGKLSKQEIYSVDNTVELKKNATVGVEVITSQDIENQGSPVISDLLNQVSGLTIQQTGSIGDKTSIRIRGSDRVRVTIDGIRVEEPNEGKFYAENFISDDFERIEIVKGPSATMGGVQASGGLIGMYTKRGYGEPSLKLQSEMGGYGSFKERVMYSGSNERSDFYLSTTFQKTDGGGRIQNQYGDLERIRNDYFKNLNATANFGHRFWENKAEIRNITRVNSAKKGLGVNEDWMSGNLYQDLNSYAKTTSFSNTTILNLKPTDYYDSSTRFGLNTQRYNFYDNIDDFDFYDDRKFFKGTKLNFLTQHNFTYKNWNKLSVGYNMEHSKYFEDSTWWGVKSGFSGNYMQNDVFINDTINIKDILFLKGGARMVNNSNFGTHILPNASAAIVLPTFKLPGSYSKIRASWGNSISQPSFYQLFGGTTSNPNLRAEQLSGYDVAFEQSFLNDKLSFDIGYFANKYKDYINWVSTSLYDGTYYNVDEANLRGYEANIKWQPNEKFRANLNYTYTMSENTATGKELTAIPNNRINGSLYYTPNSRLTLFTSVIGASERYYTTDKKVGGYVDVRLGGRVKLFSYKKMHVYLSGQIYNLLNQKITMYRGYYQPGVNFMGGLFVDFNGLGEKL